MRNVSQDPEDIAERELNPWEAEFYYHPYDEPVFFAGAWWEAMAPCVGEMPGTSSAWSRIIDIDPQQRIAQSVEQMQRSRLADADPNQSPRMVGSTASGPPHSGSFVTGDFVIDLENNVWICRQGGNPGKWSPFAASGSKTP